MATKVKRKTSASPTAKPKATKKPAEPACLWPDSDSCPTNSKKDSPYCYQKGCRGEACKTANKNYYKQWRDAGGAAAKPAAKRTSKAKPPAKKAVVAKKAKAKRSAK